MSDVVTEIQSIPLTWKNSASNIRLPIAVGSISLVTCLIIGVMVPGDRFVLKSILGPPGSLVIGLIGLQMTAIFRSKMMPSQFVQDGKLIPPVQMVLLTELAGLASILALVCGVVAWVNSVYFLSFFDIDMQRDEAISAIQKHGMASSGPLALALSGYALFLSMTGNFFKNKIYRIEQPVRIPDLNLSKLTWTSERFNVSSGGIANLIFPEPINQAASKQINWQIQKLLDKPGIQKDKDDCWENDIASKYEIEDLIRSESVNQITLKISFSSFGEFRLQGTLLETALVNQKKFQSDKIFLFKTNPCQVTPGGGNTNSGQKQNNIPRKKPDVDSILDD
jgi:hypothetical protein